MAFGACRATSSAVNPASARIKTTVQRTQNFLRRHLLDPAFLTDFELLGSRWTLLRDVFSPIETPVTELFTNWLPYPVGGSFLEVGCGTGITAVYGALVGCRRVVAVDVNVAAVENTRRNAALHSVLHQISVRHSDLYEALAPDEQFDVIYWNSNFIETPGNHVLNSALDHAYFDPGYRTHRTFLRGAAAHLAAGGRLFIGFSSLGNWPEFARACSEATWEPRILRAEQRQLNSLIEFQLVELLRVEDSNECLPTERINA